MKLKTRKKLKAGGFCPICVLPMWVEAVEPLADFMASFQRETGRKITRFGAKARQATLDHIVPKAQGGWGIENNIVVICRACNEEKANMTVTDFIGRLAQDRPSYAARAAALFGEECPNCAPCHADILLELANH